MPRVLKDSAARRIIQFSFKQPIPEPDIALPWSPTDGFPRHTELGAAADCDGGGDASSGKQLLKSFFVRASSLHIFGQIPLVLERHDLGRASNFPGAAEVDVALFAQIRELELAEHGHPVVIWIVVVPLPAVRVKEQGVLRQTVVIVDDVALAHSAKEYVGIETAHT